MLTILLLTITIEAALLSVYLVRKSAPAFRVNYKDMPINKRPRMLNDSNDVYGQNFYR